MPEYREEGLVLPEGVRNIHRALRSVIEELEAIDWYTQRAALASDAELRAVVEHNRDEEVEHASMALEWLRRNVAVWNDKLRTYLFSSGPITLVEKQSGDAREPAAAPPRGAAPGDLRIGALKTGE
jgi:uncharacterized protein